MEARCILFTAVGKIELGTTTIPDPGPHDIVFETQVSCISPGTELRCLSGRQEGLGTDSFPFIPGYALVGRVTKADAGGIHRVGSLVFCSGVRNATTRCAWGGHISHGVIPATSAFPVPNGMSAEEASLLKLAAISYRGTRVSQLSASDKVIVLGLGPIGQLSARLFAARGAPVLAADLSPHRVELCEKAGIRSALIGPGDCSAVKAIWPQGGDIVVDATGYAPAIHDAVALVIEKPWDDSDFKPGRLVIQGSYSGDLSLPSGASFSRELTIVWPRDSQRSDMQAVAELVESNKLNLNDLISGVYPVASAPAVYTEMLSGSKTLMTAVFKW